MTSTVKVRPHRLVSDAAGIAELARLAGSAPWIALDTESNSMHAYRDRLCLLQLNLGGTLAVVDPLALPPGWAEPLRAVLEDPAKPVLLHGGEYDCGVMRRDLGIQLRGVVDTQQAAALLGWERTGYAAAVEKTTGVALEKAYTTHDWGLRPLGDGPMAYALDDVHYLPEVRAALEVEIEKTDIVEEFAIACRAVEESPWSGGFDPGGFWRVKGVRELHPDCLPVFAALWAWRDGVAREQDRPPGRVVNNEALLAVARHAPISFQHLRSTGLHGRILASHGNELIEVIRAARDAPAGELPPRPNHREVLPIEEEREGRLKDWRRAEAERRKVSLQVVLPAKALEHLKRHGSADLEAVPQLGPKRIRLYGERIATLAR